MSSRACPQFAVASDKALIFEHRSAENQGLSAATVELRTRSIRGAVLLEVLVALLMASIVLSGVALGFKHLARQTMQYEARVFSYFLFEQLRQSFRMGERKLPDWGGIETGQENILGQTLCWQARLQKKESWGFLLDVRVSRNSCDNPLVAHETMAVVPHAR